MSKQPYTYPVSLLLTYGAYRATDTWILIRRNRKITSTN